LILSFFFLLFVAILLDFVAFRAVC
jgi:hypothetical protein